MYVRKHGLLLRLRCCVNSFGGWLTLCTHVPNTLYIRPSRARGDMSFLLLLVLMMARIRDQLAVGSRYFSRHIVKALPGHEVPCRTRGSGRRRDLASAREEKRI